MNRMVRTVLSCLTSAALLSGCVHADQLNELAIVTAVGIDPGHRTGSVRLTAQIIRPADARGQTGAPSGATGEPIYSISAEGRTLFEAIRNMARFSSRRVYWAHNFVIVMNEEYAKEGITEMIDFFTRNNQLRMRTWVLVTPDPASKLVSTVTGMEVVPGQAIDKLFRYNEIVAEAPRTNLMRMQEAFLSESTHPVAAKVKLIKRGISNKRPEEFGSLNQVELSGTAVFRDDRFIGYLTPDESRALLFFLEKVNSAVYAVPCPGGNSGNDSHASLEMHDYKFRLTPIVQGEAIRFQAKLSASFDMVETGCRRPIHQQKDLLEARLKEQIEKEFDSLLGKVQGKYRVDVLKLGQVLNNHYPAKWDEVKARWSEEFPDIPVETKVYVRINSTELKIRQTYPEKE